MRHNAAAIVAAVGLDVLAGRAGITTADAAAALARIEADVETLPATDMEARLDDALVRAAVDIAVGRHAGTVETVYTAQGPVQMQRGKDLSDVRWLIGTGGAIVHARDPAPYCASRAPIPRRPRSCGRARRAWRSTPTTCCTLRVCSHRWIPRRRSTAPATTCASSIEAKRHERSRRCATCCGRRFRKRRFPPTNSCARAKRTSRAGPPAPTSTSTRRSRGTRRCRRTSGSPMRCAARIASAAA